MAYYYKANICKINCFNTLIIVIFYFNLLFFFNRVISRSNSHKSSPLRNEITKRWSQLSHTTQEDKIKEEVKRERQLLHGSSNEHISIDSPPPSPCVKAVIEKSNSVSFILDLNDSQSDDSFLDLPPSPRPRSARTPTLQRRALQKSISDRNCSSLIVGNRGRDFNGFSHRWNGKSSSDFQVNGLKTQVQGKPFFEKPINGTNSYSKINDDGLDSLNGSETSSPLNSLDHVVPMRNRCYSTSESSEGGEIERESPTGLSWTVPVHQNNSCSPPKRPGLEPPPLHLREPEEDEYEELNSTDREFVEVVALGDVPPSEALSSLLAHTPTSSASPSDSELSQCGSRVELSTESDEDTSEDEDDDLDVTNNSSTTKTSRWWIPKEGAGEAMIPEELIAQYQEALQVVAKEEDDQRTVKADLTSDSEENNKSGVALDVSWCEDVDCDLTSSSEMQEI